MPGVNKKAIYLATITKDMKYLKPAEEYRFGNLQEFIVDLFTEYQLMLNAFLYRRTKNIPMDVDDVVQTSITRVLENPTLVRKLFQMHCFGSKGELKQYLRKICRTDANKLGKIFRSADFQKNAKKNGAAYNSSVSILLKEDVLSLLTKKEMELIELELEQDLPLKEIAQELDIGVAAVKKRRYSARNKIKQWLKNER